MITFETPVTVTLTVSQWLNIQVALGEAWNSFKSDGFPMLAADTMRTKHVLVAQTQSAIDAAVATYDAEQAA